MQTQKCKKCGSTNLTLKHLDPEQKGGGIFETILFWFCGIITLGLYFLFYAFAEKKKAELGTEYFECEACHFKMNAKKLANEDVDEPKKETESEEDLKEIREIGSHPIDMTTWREDRKKVVLEKREKMKKSSKKSKRRKKT